MKSNSKLLTVAMALVLTLASMTSFAKSDKTFDKAKQAVENASPDDWKTFAKSAQMLIRKKANMAEAKEWIEKSISIRETPFNLEVFGDYYVKNDVPKKAVDYYIQSMHKAREINPQADVSRIQEKVIATSKMQ